MPEVRSPTVRRRELGALLRALRTQKGLTVEQAAERLMFSMSKLSRIETGHGAATPRDTRDLCVLYGVTDEAERERMMRLAREGKEQGWWQPYDLPYSTYVGLEAEAASIRSFHPSVVPGLLQTEEYARAVHDAAEPESSITQLTPDVVEQRVKARLRRQRLLREINPLGFWAVLDEAVLHRVVGSPGVMERQLGHIAELASLRNVTVQVISYGAGAHPAPGSMFNILEFDAAVPDVVYVEGLAGWIYIERPEDVSRYNRVFARLSEMALDSVKSTDLIQKIRGAYAACL
ncbi:MAG: helix-turn-helix domain-containing protein [Streptosporangiaceae bacterium]